MHSKLSDERWILDQSSIFAQVDAFVQRCKDLLEVQCTVKFCWVSLKNTIFNKYNMTSVYWFGKKGMHLSLNLITKIYGLENV